MAAGIDAELRLSEEEGVLVLRMTPAQANTLSGAVEQWQQEGTHFLRFQYPEEDQVPLYDWLERLQAALESFVEANGGVPGDGITQEEV